MVNITFIITIVAFISIIVNITFIITVVAFITIIGNITMIIIPVTIKSQGASHECLSQADSACSTLSPTAAAIMEHNGFHEEIFGPQV